MADDKEGAQNQDDISFLRTVRQVLICNLLDLINSLFKGVLLGERSKVPRANGANAL